MSNTPLFTDAVCIGCLCSENSACSGGCWWLTVDYTTGDGVCSQCAEMLPQWRQRQTKLVEAIR